MNFNFGIKDFFIHRKKEILVILLYSAWFIVVISLISKINLEIEDAKYDKTMAEIKYNDVKNSNLSEEDLTRELQEVNFEVESLNKKLPSNLDHMEINKMLSEISKANGGLFSLGNCNITQTQEKDKRISFEVKITSVKGNYDQFKSFVEYIEKYKSKVILSKVDLKKTSYEVQGSMTLKFFSSEKVGDRV